MPVILFLLCVLWLLGTMLFRNRQVRIGQNISNRTQETISQFKNRVTDRDLESKVTAFHSNSLGKAWTEANEFTKGLPTWDRLRAEGYYPNVSPLDIDMILMVSRYGKLPAITFSNSDLHNVCFIGPDGKQSKIPEESCGYKLYDELLFKIEDTMKEKGCPVTAVITAFASDKGGDLRYVVAREYARVHGPGSYLRISRIHEYTWKECLPSYVRPL